MIKDNKFILLHIDSEEANAFLNEAISVENVERGLMFKSNIMQEMKNHFEYMKSKGYFPIGAVVDFNNTKNIEYLFKRHPNQTDEMKLLEFKHENPKVL